MSQWWNFFRRVQSYHTLHVHLIIGFLFLALTGFCIFTGFSPTHDAIRWHGAFHYFYSSVERGVIPYWNSYSQTGTPFFNNFQSFGLLLPLQFFGVLFQKLTGCTTLTTYILFYFSMYYFFIAGTYCTLKLITNHSLGSLFFSLVLFLASFPNFMRQNGALHSFFLFPFITFFLLVFFKESRKKRKALYLIILSFLCALSLNVYIPMWLLFYLLLCLSFVFLFKIIDLRKTIQFLSSKHGLLGLSISVIVALLVLSPVIALYYELHHGAEYFPTLRFLQVNGNFLVKCYASDFQENLFSEGFTKNSKISLSRGNFVGLVLEPFRCLFPAMWGTEIVLYLGLLPLLCIGPALTAPRKKYAYFFLSIAGLTLGIACNFGGGQTGTTQQIMLTLLPFLKMSDVLINGGTLFLFSIAIVGAIGFESMFVQGRRGLWIISILAVTYKYLILLPLMFNYTLCNYGNVDWTEKFIMSKFIFIGGTLFLFMVLLCIYLTYALIKKASTANVRRLRYVAITIVFLELLSFNAFYVLYSGPVLRRKYATYLQERQLLYTEPESAFMNYRLPFSFESSLFSSIMEQHPRNNFSEQEGVLFSTFFEHELYAVKKVAFPAAVEKDLVLTRFELTKDSMAYLRRKEVPEETIEQLKQLKHQEFLQEQEFLRAVEALIGKQQTEEYKEIISKSAHDWQEKKRYFADWDHFYMTTAYYDYLVNIKYSKQFITSHIITPILNFFSQEHIIWCNSKYEVVKQINEANFSELLTHIFIERDQTIHEPALAIEELFNSDNFVFHSQETFSNIQEAIKNKYSANPDVLIDVIDYSVNHLSLKVETPYDGYLYFGDGYSKHWKAFVDGTPTTIEKTNINFKSVYTPAGKHEVKFVYDPVLFRYSLYAYFAGNIFFLAVLAGGLTKRYWLRKPGKMY